MVIMPSQSLPVNYGVFVTASENRCLNIGQFLNGRVKLRNARQRWYLAKASSGLARYPKFIKFFTFISFHPPKGH